MPLPWPAQQGGFQGIYLMKSGKCPVGRASGQARPMSGKTTPFPRSDGGEQIENLHFQSKNAIDIFKRKIFYPDEATLRTSRSSLGQIRRSGVSNWPSRATRALSSARPRASSNCRAVLGRGRERRLSSGCTRTVTRAPVCSGLTIRMCFSASSIDIRFSPLRAGAVRDFARFCVSDNAPFPHDRK